MEREHVVVVPGEAFGAPGFLRFSYATSIERIEEGLRRLEHFFASAATAQVTLAPARLAPIFVPRIWGSRNLAPLFPLPAHSAGSGLANSAKSPSVKFG